MCAEPFPGQVLCLIESRAKLRTPNDLSGFQLNDMPWAIERAPHTSSSHLGNVDRPLDGTLISVCHLGDCTPECLPCFGLVVEEDPEDCRPHCRSVTC